jgi:hypothetical protein
MSRPLRLWASIVGPEKFGLSANEMFARFTMDDLYEMMAANRIYAEIIEADMRERSQRSETEQE